MRIVDESTLVPDESLTIDEGAVAPWQTLMWSLMKDIAREMGVRTDVPFKELTEQERNIVFTAQQKRSISYTKIRQAALRETWILPILTPHTPSKTRFQK